MKELKSVLKHLNKEEVKLASEKVDLSLLDDVTKALDSANSKRRKIEQQIKKLSSDLSSLSPDYMKAFKMAKDAEKMAKDLGIDSAAKQFGARADEAKDYSDVVLKVSNSIDSELGKI